MLTYTFHDKNFALYRDNNCNSLFKFSWYWHKLNEFRLEFILRSGHKGDCGLTFCFTFLIVSFSVCFPQICRNDKNYDEMATGFKLYRMPEIGELIFNWQLWHPQHSWCTKTPRWRYCYVCIQDLLFGEWEINTDEIYSKDGVFNDEMLNKTHKANFKVIRYNRHRKKFAFIKDPFHRIEINIDGEGCPVPGKGENSWDCDDRFVNNLSIGIGSYPIPDDWVKYACDCFDKSIRRDRERYGGANWVSGVIFKDLEDLNNQVEDIQRIAE